MEIYLIRHTAPAIDKGICYGQSDVAVSSNFFHDAQEIKKRIPPNIKAIYSSPLTRCRQLAEFLFPGQQIEYMDELKEINCGRWELKSWEQIDKDELDHWMKNFVHVCFPGGESLLQLHERVVNAFSSISQSGHSPVAIITHAGVIRSILSFALGTPISECFTHYNPAFGAVIHIPQRGN
jgi:alpha-ribazole phosphatase